MYEYVFPNLLLFVSKNNIFVSESWLKAFSDEPKSKRKKKKKSEKANHSEDSLSVLDAAGLTGRQFSWAKNFSSKLCFSFYLFKWSDVC